ncbi:MAG: hypothetical protein LCH76_10605 [Actinobacteria bacterium]|nr:hypothetical protein [Actinomycetota bacterium]
MGSLLHPVGPEEPRVYWTRRFLVLIVLLALGAVGWWWVWPQLQTISAVPASSPPPTPPPSAPASTPATSPAATPKPSPTPTGPVACDPGVMKLDVAGFQKVKVSTKQTFTLSLVNGGQQACILTVSPKTFQLKVVSGKDRIWSTAHCDDWLPADKVTLKPGATHEFQLVWPLRRSGEGCKLDKDKLKPGTYVAEVALGGQTTAKQVMQLVK